MSTLEKDFETAVEDIKKIINKIKKIEEFNIGHFINR